MRDIDLTGMMDEENLNDARDDGEAAKAAPPTASRGATLSHLLRFISVQAKCSGVSFEEALEQLLVLVDGDDALVAFMALQSLRETLLLVQDYDVASHYIKFLLEHRPDCARASRFQLLRQLLKPRKDEPATNSDGEASDSDESAIDSPHEWYLRGLLAESSSFEVLLKATFDQTSASYDRTHEALGCLQDIVKLTLCEETSLLDGSAAGITRIVSWAVMQGNAWDFRREEDPTPTFLACSLIDLLVISRPLYHATDTEWLPMAIQLLKPSGSLCLLAFQLLHDASMVAGGCCADSFVSSTCPFPLLQNWIHLCCVTAIEGLENIDLLVESTLTDRHKWTSIVTTMPPRARLLAVLSEQDDTMIDVLLLFLQIHSAVQERWTPLPVELRRILEEQCDPHLLFADLLGIFGDDHLVILDMLTSSETRMLEYASHYLRLATATWSQAHEKWDAIGRTDSVMAVLIRLRLEMERLLDAGVFPYNPKPLLRRLEMLEELFENQ